LEGFNFKGPQGEKVIRPEDHQAVLDMYLQRCEGGKQVIVGKRKGAEVAGPIECKGF
jgi:hypothetical protein